MTTQKRVSMISAAFVCLIALASQPLADDETFKVEINTNPITSFTLKDEEKRQFGALRFQSGATFFGDNPAFGGFSGLHIVEQGRGLIAISDTGNWLKARIDRDEKGGISGLSRVTMIKLQSGIGPEGADDKEFSDAEGLAYAGDRLFVSFERIHTISEYRFDDQEIGGEPKQLQLPADISLRAGANRGLEALAFGKNKTALAGHLVTILQRARDRTGPTVGWILHPDGESDKVGRFELKRDRLFDITGAAFTDNGDLLVLERRFTLATGPAIRVRFIEGGDIKAGAVLRGRVIMEADASHQIDNMESLSVYENPQGETIIALLSDDNHSLLQRTILLEFSVNLKEL